MYYVKTGYRTFQPRTFQPQASTPDFSTPEFSTINSSTSDPYGVEKLMVESKVKSDAFTGKTDLIIHKLKLIILVVSRHIPTHI